VSECVCVCVCTHKRTMSIPGRSMAQEQAMGSRYLLLFIELNSWRSCDASVEKSRSRDHPCSRCLCQLLHHSSLVHLHLFPRIFSFVSPRVDMPDQPCIRTLDTQAAAPLSLHMWNKDITELQSDHGTHTNELMHTHALFV
jgi:hypothetical protein